MKHLPVDFWSLVLGAQYCFGRDVVFVGEMDNYAGPDMSYVVDLLKREQDLYT